MNHSAIVQPGSNMCVCGMPDDHPVHGFVEWVPKCRADRQCMAKEHDRNCPQAIALELAAERRKMSDRQMPVSMVLETNKGGVPVTICDRETITELLAGGLAALEWAFTQARRRVAEWEPAPCPPLPRRYWHA